MSAQGCSDPTTRQCVEGSVSVLCYIMFLVRLPPVHGCFAVQTAAGLEYKEDEKKV